MQYENQIIEDFTNPLFTAAFQAYFAELGITVSNYDALFQEMNEGGNNRAYVHLDEHSSVVGFIQFTLLPFTSWFFETKMGFIREFWVAPELRGLGHGTQLLEKAEAYFISQEVYRSILTTDTAESFYLRHGYQCDMDISAKNGDAVFIKRLR